MGQTKKARGVAVVYGSIETGADTGTAAAAEAEVLEERDLTDTVRMPDSESGALLAV
jgi:hypothetical protein